MKKLIIFTTWMLMSISANAQSIHFDVNGNDTIDLTDALLVVDYILGRYTPEDVNTAFSELGCPDGNHPHMIDLGLPSGTKWACCNVGARRPNEYGSYYAWGETYGKDEYTEFNYDFCSSEDNEEIPIWDRYSEYENIGEDICGSKYDVAHKKWGKAWQMPSIGAIQEIIENCSFEWVIIKGIKGGKSQGPTMVASFYQRLASIMGQKST